MQILDHGICDGTPYIAMELLEGEDLRNRLDRVQRLSPAELHSTLNQVCRALTKAHALGIVHRDLKPDNIFIVRDDDRELVKVLDFEDLPKSQAPDVVGSNTRTGAMLGTPYYMSPEQAQGIKTVDARSDLWSLAVIAFRALTTRLPFESDALGDLLVKIIVSDIPVPSTYGPVPSGFDAWWRRASARDPAARFQTAKEFADSLALVCQVSQVSGVMDRGVLGGGSLGSPALGQSQPGASSPGFLSAPVPLTTPSPVAHTLAMSGSACGDRHEPGRAGGRAFRRRHHARGDRRRAAARVAWAPRGQRDQRVHGPGRERRARRVRAACRVRARSGRRDGHFSGVARASDGRALNSDARSRQARHARARSRGACEAEAFAASSRRAP